ncbi:30 kDa heat shock protein [Cladobotryum mycophilum]|uniref:30 kDa heat shock protein n=1 Tax=Cladobotryum mycophilum TaxID=491253 RepID=A0ABR0SAQ8_9HYPO
MVFFQRSFYTPETTTTSFTPSSASSMTLTTTLAAPKFDVRETSEAYELHGELPGLSKEDVHIEFTGHNSMLISGKVDRTYNKTSAAPADATIPDGTATSDAITETSEENQRPRSPYQATVEDEAEEGAPATSSAPSEEQVTKTPSTTTAATATTPKQPTDKSKFWLTERSIGQFSRTFNFPINVNQDSVTANFKDGILHVVIPKAAKHEPRRIAVL